MAFSVSKVPASLAVSLPGAEPEPTDSGSGCTLSKRWCVCVCVCLCGWVGGCVC